MHQVYFVNIDGLWRTAHVLPRGCERARQLEDSQHAVKMAEFECWQQANEFAVKLCKLVEESTGSIIGIGTFGRPPETKCRAYA